MTTFRTVRPTRRVGLGAAAASVALAAACSGGGDASPATTAAPTVAPTAATTTTTTPPTTVAPTTPSTAAPTTTTTTEATTTTTTPPVYRQPLTGEVVESADDVLNRPALVVKIDNHSSARRNHSGLGVADIVFEEKVEGQITRFAAVFHSRDSDPVGPIRSGRSQDVDLLTGLRNPLFAWSGGNPGVTRAIAESTFVDLNWQHTPSTYYRGAGSTPHNLYSSTARLWDHIPFGHPGAPPRQFRYLAEGREFAGDPVQGVDLRIGSIDVSWDWDPERGEFMRTMEGSPHVDALHGPIGATNVVLMVVEYRPDPIDTRSPAAVTIGNGPAYIFSDGRVIEGRWGRYTSDQPLNVQEVGTGKPIPINPGTTWIELMEAGDNPDGDANWPTAEFTIRY